jgi:hypothetical protein
MGAGRDFFDVSAADSIGVVDPVDAGAPFPGAGSADAVCGGGLAAT